MELINRKDKRFDSCLVSEVGQIIVSLVMIKEQNGLRIVRNSVVLQIHRVFINFKTLYSNKIINIKEMVQVLMVLLKSALMVVRLVMMVVRDVIVKLKVVLMVSVHQRGVVLNAELVVVDVMETMVASVIVTSAKVDSVVRE